MPLTDAAVRNAKPTAKPYRLFDASGLYLEVAPRGGRWWRFKYRYDGKEKRLSLGTYPDTGLREARARRDEARKLVAAGVDPSDRRREAQADKAQTLEAVAREWVLKQSAAWVPSHATRVLARLEQNAFPWIGSRSVRTLSAPELLSCLRRLEGRGAVESAHRLLQNFGQILRYAIATGRADKDVASGLRGALGPSKPVHRAAIVEPRAIGSLLRAIDGYQGSMVTRSALMLAPLLFVRPGELRQARWSEFDLESGTWAIPASRMKMREGHIVPLAAQALAILHELRALTGGSEFVFPSARTASRPMSNNAVLAALRRMGFAKDEMTGHGFRAMARTVLDEVLQFRPDFIEHQLAHAVRDPNGRAYNRTAYLPERRAMMASWANYLDSLKNGSGNVVAMRRA